MSFGEERPKTFKEVFARAKGTVEYWKEVAELVTRERDALAARVEALERERDEYKRQADVRIALEPASHVHTFAWNSTGTVGDEPPLLSTCWDVG